jgi:hypothetical protein
MNACNRPPANDERQIAEPEWSVELTLQPWSLCSEIHIIRNGARGYANALTTRSRMLLKGDQGGYKIWRG